jgi:hypothetical protein
MYRQAIFPQVCSAACGIVIPEVRPAGRTDLIRGLAERHRHVLVPLVPISEAQG